jgi:pentatricopeptide repeat protein
MMIIAVCTRSIILRVFSSSSTIVNYSIKTNKNKSTSPEPTNQLIKTLTHRGDYERAFQLFDTLVKQNNLSIISLLTILDTCTRSGYLEYGHQIERLINQSIQWKDHIRLQTSLINMYMTCQKIDQGKIDHRKEINQ